jgi:hypothetical protein
LESQKNQFTGEATKDNVQTLFNDWLNKNYDGLDKMKNTTIDNQIVKKTTFELQSFKTLIELKSFQKQLQENNEEIKTITLQESDIKINFYNKVTSTQVFSAIN